MTIPFILILIPLSLLLLERISPAAVAIHQQQYLSVTPDAVREFPLSIDSARTLLGLTFLAGFGVLLVGSARALTRDGARLLATGVVLLGVALAIAGIVQRATFYMSARFAATSRRWAGILKSSRGFQTARFA